MASCRPFRLSPMTPVYVPMFPRLIGDLSATFGGETPPAPGGVPSAPVEPGRAPVTSGFVALGVAATAPPEPAPAPAPAPATGAGAPTERVTAGIAPLAAAFGSGVTTTCVASPAASWESRVPQPAALIVSAHAASTPSTRF